MADKKTSFGKIVLIVLGVILALLGINYLINRNKQPQGTQDINFRLPTSVDPSVFGPEYWKAFHTLAEKVPCGLCRGFAEKFIVFFHDTVNLKLGKKLHDPENYDKFTQLISDIRLNGNKWPANLTPSEETVVEPAH